MSGGKKKVLIVVLAVDAEPWRSIEELGQRGTWADPEASASVMWLHGVNSGLTRLLTLGTAKCLGLIGAKRAQKIFRRKVGAWFAARPVRACGRYIQTSVPESYLMTNAKTVAAFRHLLETEEFDFILRTNSSSYVELGRLEEFVQTLPEGGYYGGAVWRVQGLEYVTGSTILMSRDLVEHAVRDPEWDFELIDDMALGRSMRRRGVKPQSVERVDVLTADDLSHLDSTSLSATFLVRCKGEENREHDILAMRKVHSVYRAMRVTES